jgi:hypothetical protein
MKALAQHGLEPLTAKSFWITSQAAGRILQFRKSLQLQLPTLQKFAATL